MKYFFIIYLYKREEGCPSKMFLFFQGKGTLNLLLVIRGKGGRERERDCLRHNPNNHIRVRRLSFLEERTCLGFIFL